MPVRQPLLTCQQGHSSAHRPSGGIHNRQAHDDSVVCVEYEVEQRCLQEIALVEEPSVQNDAQLNYCYPHHVGTQRPWQREQAAHRAGIFQDMKRNTVGTQGEGAWPAPPCVCALQVQRDAHSVQVEGREAVPSRIVMCEDHARCWGQASAMC